MAEHQIDDPKIAFAYLRPSCVLLTKAPTVENVKSLDVNLRSVSDGVLQQLQDYVLFPLRFVLKVPGPKRDALIQVVMETMSYILENTCVQRWESLRDLFSELCLCLCSPKDPGKPGLTSEELKLSVLRCLDGLLHSAYGDIVFKLYEPSMLPGLGAAVSLLLAIAEQEKARGVQTASLKCLLSLFQQCDCTQDHVEIRPNERFLLGRTLATFLPGISRALSHVIGGDVRQGHAVTVRAMKVWYRSVALVMADEQFEKTDVDNTVVSDLDRVQELIVKRTPSWRKTTSQRLLVVLQKIISYTSAHAHWRVRLELVNMSHVLLSNCSRTMSECVGFLLEALVGTVNDDESDVKNRCNVVLREIAQKSQGDPVQDFTDVLSENLHGLVTSLPRLMRTTDDQRKLFTLNVFLGYLQILGPKVDAVLMSAVHLERISKALMQVLELDVTDVKIIEDRTLTPSTDFGPDVHQLQPQRKYFLYFTDEKIFSALRKICRMLGYYGNLYLLVDCFMELYKESCVYRKQAALVLNEIVVGAAGIGLDDCSSDCFGLNRDDVRSSAESIIEEYISFNNWHLPTVSDALDGETQITLESPSSMLANPDKTHLQMLPDSRTSTLHHLNSNIWQISIQLEGIGGFALALGTDFRLLLMTSLYPVLEKAGDESLLISQSAFSAMCDICKACDYSSPKELVIKNSDYLLNDVSLNLARSSAHQHAPRVLAVMFSHSDADLLPLVADVVQDVLTSLDLSYDLKTPQFCAVLHSLMKALVRWFPTSTDYPKPNSTKSEDCVNLRTFLLDYKKQKEMAEGIGVEEEDPDDLDVHPSTSTPDEDMEGPAVKEELPLHIQISKDVMKRCVHLLSDSKLRIRLKVLDILELCVCVLCEKENELLPMVHQCWPALLHRLIGDDPLVVPRAFRVLCVLGESCGDFLRKRVSQEVLPRLTSSLLKQAEISARSGPVYTHTLAYKLQLAVLQGLGPLCVKLNLMEADLDRISDACIPYLSCRQPIKLQEACLSVFHHLMDLDADWCWFTLNEIFCPVVYKSPHPHLLPVMLSGSDKPKNEFTDNILRLLHDFDSSQEMR